MYTNGYVHHPSLLEQEDISFFVVVDDDSFFIEMGLLGCSYRTRTCTTVLRYTACHYSIQLRILRFVVLRITHTTLSKSTV